MTSPNQCNDYNIWQALGNEKENFVPMARMKDSEKSKKQQLARDLYLKEVSNHFICEATGIALKTLQSWAKDGNWNDLRVASTMTPSHIRTLILETVSLLKKGEQPKYSPDQLSKLASAFEKFSDKDQHLGYFLDAYTTLATTLLQRAQALKAPDDRQRAITFAQEVITVTDSIIADMSKL